MGYYLLDHPPASRQFYETRTNTPTWAVGVHTTESVMDTVSIDTGAENVAGFISRRSDAGSYHVIVDSDSSVPMMPDSYTAFQIAAAGFNSRTLGVALACRETELDPDHWWTQRAIARLGVEIRTRWIDHGIDPSSAAWWGTRDDALATACLFNHGDAQPQDRRDAFVDHPQQDRLQQMVIDAVLAGSAAPNPKEWDEMASQQEVQAAVSQEVAKHKCFYDMGLDTPPHYEVFGFQRKYIKADELEHLIRLGIISKPEGIPGTLLERYELVD